MGHGILKRKKLLKEQFLGTLQKELQRLQIENKAIKEDPKSVIGQFISQFNDILEQNQRLSALVCSLIETSEAKSLTMSRSALEAFRGKRLNIHVNSPDGVTELEKADTYVFTYEILPATPSQNPVGPVGSEATPATPVDPTLCTAPECDLPEDFPHSHTNNAPAN